MLKIYPQDLTVATGAEIDTGTDNEKYVTAKAIADSTMGTGSVSTVSVVTANGFSGTVANPTTAPAITIIAGAIVPTSVNGLTLVAATTGFTIAGGTTSKTLTVNKTITLSSADDTSVITLPAGTKTLLATDGSAASLTSFPTLNQNTTGSAGSVKSPSTTGVITITGMGAGETRVKTVRDANDTILELGGSYTPTGTWVWTSVTGTWPTFNQNTSGTASKATNLVGGNSTTLLGSIPYQSNTDTTTMVVPNTTITKKYLSMTGTGTNGAVPSWEVGDGSGTVTTVSVTTANGVSGTVANATTTPAITLTLGAITPTSVNGLTLSANNTDFNTLVGTLAGANIVSGAVSNTFIGYAAGQMGTATNAADYNTAVGSQSLNSLAGGNANTAVGYQALTLVANGTNNTAIGFNALHDNFSGSYNIGIGTTAGRYELGSNAFYVDCLDRTNTAGDKAGAILYGLMNATPASQTLTTNSAFTATYGMNIPSGQTYKINNVALTTANIADSTDARYCTDAQKVVIGNTSGTNSGDNAANSTADMLLGTVQSVTAEKVFTKDKISTLGTSTGKTVISTANTSATDYTQTMQARNGTIANQDDVTYIGTTSVALNRTSAALTLAGITLTTPTLNKPVVNGTDPTGAVYSPATGAQGVALDCALNNMHIVNGHADGTAITFTISNATNNQPFIVMIKQGAVVSTIAAWFAGISWCGSAPTLTATINKTDTFGFIRTGNNIYIGYIVGQNA
jgi:hypothetical protein